MVATTTLPAPLATIADKINTLEATTSGIVLESVPEIRCAVNAILSGRHVCLIGPPGIAKSFLTRTLVGLISDMGDGAYFETLLGKMDTPEKILGPVSPRALMEDDEYRRNTARKLPVAKVAFLDEIWEASSALLEYLLPILNERMFHNNGGPEPVPLVTAFMASNKTPERSNELAAVWDRVTFRLFSRPIQDDGSFTTMLRMAAARYARNGFARQDVLPPVISWDEIVLAQQAVQAVEIPDDVFEALTDLRRTLAHENIVPSDRRFAESLPIIRAQAFREGRMVADIEDMRLLAHVLWSTHDQQPVVQRLVYELANPLDKIAMEMMDDVEALATEVDAILRESDNNQDRSRRAIEVHGKLEQAAGDVGKLRKQAKDEGRKSEIIEPLRQRVLGLTRLLLREVFTFDEKMLGEDPPE
jgi:MoxR-like ATPase